MKLVCIEMCGDCCFLIQLCTVGFWATAELSPGAQILATQLHPPGSPPPHAHLLGSPKEVAACQAEAGHQRRQSALP